jgi:hypothetical protein
MLGGVFMRQHSNTLSTDICRDRDCRQSAVIGRNRSGLILLLLAVSCATGANAADWDVSVVDPLAGMFSSMQFDVYGNAHVSYLYPIEHQLRYAFWDHILNKWFTTNLDRSGGFSSLALDSHQHPHISYHDYAGGLMYAHWNGVSWQKQAIPIAAKDISFYTSIALDQDDHPSISFYEVETGEGDRLLRLRSVRWNGDFWALTTVDETKGSGKFNSIAVDSKGRPHIAYGNVQYENASMRYAHWNGASWEDEILEGEGKPGSSSWSVAMVLGKDDNPHITYTDIPHLLVKYATKKDGKWKIEAVGSLAREGYPDRNGIALDDRGNVYISYFDAGTGSLKVAHRQDQKWVAEIVDHGSLGFQSSLRIDHGVIWVTYSNVIGNVLKVAHRPLDGTEARGQGEMGGAHKTANE